MVYNKLLEKDWTITKGDVVKVNNFVKKLSGRPDAYMDSWAEGKENNDIKEIFCKIKYREDETAESNFPVILIIVKCDRRKDHVYSYDKFFKYICKENIKNYIGYYKNDID